MSIGNNSKAPGLALGDLADNSKIPYALRDIAAVQLSALLSNASAITKTMTWKEKAAESFLLKGEAEIILKTNIGLFHVIVRRG